MISHFLLRWVAFGFGTSSCPIRRRKEDAPKSRARVHKVDAYLSLRRFMRADIDHARRHAISSPVLELRRVSNCPIETFKPNKIMAPCAFTVTVRVSSETGLLSASPARTITETFTIYVE